MLPLLGALLLVLLLVDLFLTVFHAQGRGGPLNRVQNRAVWALFRRAGIRGDGTSRAGLLGFAAPVMAVVTLTIWVVLLVVGYALIYYPWMPTFLVSPGEFRTSWVEALYYSGYTAATLGFGDVVADREALRLLTVLEALSGFALLSASVTYLLAVYRELIAMQSLASNIAGYSRSAEVHTLQFVRAGGYEAMARWAEGITSRLLQVLQAHFQYPILHYFRPSERKRALPVQFGFLLALRGVADREDLAQPVTLLEHHPSFLALQDAVGEYLRTVEEVFVPERFGGEKQEDRDPLERAHERLLGYMRYPQTGAPNS